MMERIRYYLRTFGLRGLFCAVKAKVSSSVVSLKVERLDVKFPFFLRIPSSDTLTYDQIFLHQEYDFVAENPPKVIVDAGANIGLASIFFANRYPDAKIIAIEPESGNFEFLKQNVEPYPNVIPVQAALWDHNTSINLVDPGLGSWGFMTQEDDRSAHQLGEVCHNVTAMTVDKVMLDYGLEKIDILKIDIEGAEREVFRDPTLWIDKVDALIVELHERMKPGCNRSFYKSTNDEFDHEWIQGENVYLSRRKVLTRRPI